MSSFRQLLARRDPANQTAGSGRPWTTANLDSDDDFGEDDYGKESYSDSDDEDDQLGMRPM